MLILRYISIFTQVDTKQSAMLVASMCSSTFHILRSIQAYRGVPSFHILFKSCRNDTKRLFVLTLYSLASTWSFSIVVTIYFCSDFRRVGGPIDIARKKIIFLLQRSAVWSLLHQCKRNTTYRVTAGAAADTQQHNTKLYTTLKDKTAH